MERKKKVALVIFISYVICYVPVMIRGVFLSAKVHAGSLWSPLAFVFHNINYINNVFICGVMDKTYRRKLRKLLCKNSVQDEVTPFDTSIQSLLAEAIHCDNLKFINLCKYLSKLSLFSFLVLF